MAQSKRGVLLMLVACWMSDGVQGFSPTFVGKKVGAPFRRALTSDQWGRQQHSMQRMESTVVFPAMKCGSSSRLSAKKKNIDDNKKQDGNKTSPATIWKSLQDKPGGFIFLPFVVIFGLDLLLNIVFIAKRSFEFLVLGQAPSQETWY